MQTLCGNKYEIIIIIIGYLEYIYIYFGPTIWGHVVVS